MAEYPTPQPVGRPVMLQSWCNLTFLHWRMPVTAIAARVPAPLEVESCQGSGWVGITPFRVAGLRLPFIPALPWISEFAETNCRTYVKGPDGKSGIWFFSLDAARAAAVLGARIGYGLPYAWSRMRVQVAGRRVRYESRRRWPGPSAATRIEVEYGEPVEAGELEIFLTARFRLYSFIAGRLTYTKVEHPPWPLRGARVEYLEQTLTHAAGLPEPNGAPLVHFSPGVRTRIGSPELARRKTRN